MDLTPFFQSVLEQDTAPIVLCDLSHTILYINPTAAQRYAKRGGYALLGQNLLDCHNAQSVAAIERILDWFQADTKNNRVFTFRNEKECKDVYMIALRDSHGTLIGYYEKHAYRAPETRGIYALEQD